jgi:hypothetical protein
MTPNDINQIVQIAKTIVETRDLNIENDETRFMFTILLNVLMEKCGRSPTFVAAVFHYLCNVNGFNIKNLKGEAMQCFNQQFKNSLLNTLTTKMNKVEETAEEIFSMG